MTLAAAIVREQGLRSLTADGVSVLGGSSATPFFIAQGSPAVASSQVAGGAITAASETSMLPAAAKRTIKGNTLYVGARLRITASGLISSVITTPGTARFKVKLGPTANIAVFDSLAILLDSAAAHTNKGWRLAIDLTCLAIGSGTSANFWGDGEFKSEDIAGQAAMPVGSLVAMLPWNSSPAAGTGFDSTVDNVLDLTFTQTVGTGSITLEQYLVEQVA